MLLFTLVIIMVMGFVIAKHAVAWVIISVIRPVIKLAANIVCKIMNLVEDQELIHIISN